MKKKKFKHHYIRVDSPDGSCFQERILSVREDGIKVDRYGYPLILTDRFLDDYKDSIYIDGCGEWLFFPYAEKHELLKKHLGQQKSSA